MDVVIGGGWAAAPGWLGAWALVFGRVLGLCLTAPGLAVPGFSGRFRLVLAGLLAALVSPVVAPGISGLADWPAVGWAFLAELLTGALLGLAAGLIVAGARAAGDLAAAQAGLATASFFDPETGEELTAAGHLYGWIATLTFLGLDGPLALIRSLVESYEIVPAGKGTVGPETLNAAFGQVGRALELALRAAAPVAVALILAGIALAWLTRAAPSIPFLIMSLPIRAVLGVVLILMGLAVLATVFSQAWTGLLGTG